MKGVIVMVQLGQVVQLKSKTAGGEALWGYRYRVGGRGSRRVQRGGFQSEPDAGEALERALERLRRANGMACTLTLALLVDEYLAQHDAQPETVEKLRWLLAKAVAERCGRCCPALSPGHDRCQPGQAGRRQPAAATNRETTVRVLGAAGLRLRAG
jgi:hypothetical protein